MGAERRRRVEYRSRHRAGFFMLTLVGERRGEHELPECPASRAVGRAKRDDPGCLTLDLGKVTKMAHAAGRLVSKGSFIETAYPAGWFFILAAAEGFLGAGQQPHALSGIA